MVQADIRTRRRFQMPSAITPNSIRTARYDLAVSDNDRSSRIEHLEPLGLICGGTGTPLTATWIDLSAPNQVFYGLNGAGKTTVISSLCSALEGQRGGGKILARIPINHPNVGMRFEDAVSMMLTGSRNFAVDHAHDLFVEAQCEVLGPEMNRRLEWAVVDAVPESRFRDLDWGAFLEDLGRTDVWLFTPTGTDAPRWAVNPVVLAEPSGHKWSEHLAELMLILPHDDGPIPDEIGLDLLWMDAPVGAPLGIVGSLQERSTMRQEWHPWWPFGQVVSDDTVDAAELVRQHLVSHPAPRGGSAPRPVKRGAELKNRLLDIERRANLLMVELLADAPALHLSLGKDADWFAGRSCTWTATRFDGDRHMRLDRLSSAEMRWATVAIKLALADELNASYDRTQSGFQGAKWSDADAIEGSATTWLLLDEPERGLHRTAETHMASGIGRRTGSGLRSILATHSPDLLDYGIGEVNYVRRRSRDRPGAVISMRDFEGVRDDLGLNPSDMLRRTRGFALVEGEHDLRILTAMIGADLARLGVELLPLRGGKQLRTATDSRFLYEFTDAILFPILDDLMLVPVTELWTRHVAGARIKQTSQVTAELRSDLSRLTGKGWEFLEEFLSAAIANGTFERVQPLGIPQSDILECLPVQSVVSTAESWAGLRETARRSNGNVAPSETKFKEFLTKAHKADLSPENIEELARTSPVHRDIKALLAAIDARLAR